MPRLRLRLRPRPLLAVFVLLLTLPASATDTAAGDSRGTWVCPPCVHPDVHVVEEAPGQCPICGMDLVPRDELVYAAILVFDGVQIIDYTGPYEVFGQAKLYTYTVSPDGGPISTTMDMRVTPHYGLHDAPRPDVLLVPGGHVDDVLGDERVLSWIRETAGEAEHVLSVCNGAFLLAEAGLLDGLRATTFHELLPDLAETYPDVQVLAGARYVDNGKIVTSAGLSAGLDAALHVVGKIQGWDEASRLARHLEYDWRARSGEEDAVVVGRPLSEDRLHDYDGIYEYEDGKRVTLAASPFDRNLHAFLDGARHPLTSFGEDRFLNAAGELVVFERGDDGGISGYRLPEDSRATLYRRLQRDVELPDGIWMPRPTGEAARPDLGVSRPEDLDDGLPVGTLEGTGLSRALVEGAVAGVVDGTYPDVHGLLVAKDGRLVVEEYFYQYDRDALHQLRSTTKSVVSVLVGIAIDRGLIASVEEEVLPYFDEYRPVAHPSPEKSGIRIVDLLTQRSGLACDDWDPDSPGNETKMGPAEDWVAFVLDLPMASTPGTSASYCSGGVILLGRIVEKAAGTLLETFAERHLFDPLGIDAFRWRFEPDRSSAGTFCQLYLGPRDMMKLGLLVANRGVWQGRRVVSEAWIEQSTGRHSRLGGSDYGYLWWHDRYEVDGAVHEALLATGNGGQKIHVWGDLGLVTVLTGGNYNRQSPSREILSRHVLASF